MTTLTITVEAICSGMGHWLVRTSAGGVVVGELPVDFEALQAGATDGELEAAALTLLKAACVGKTIQEVEPILLAGIQVTL